MKTKNKNLVKALGILVIGMLLGWLLFGGGGTSEEDEHEHTETASSEDQIWTCSMHPQIRQNEPGDCPICGMDLIPLETTESGDDPGSYQMSENAMKLANVQTMVVGRGDASRKIRLNGKVQVDERNSYSQSTHIPGRIEQLTINFTGESVNRGQTLATLYSPELVTAQEELLQAASIRENQPELFEAAKQKLRNWKIGEAQIEQIVAGGQALERFSIRADVNGIVTEKMVDLGDYVERGMPIYEISDLSKVWVLFDLYEGQLSWINEGSEVDFTINSFPGETFEGTISFVDPLLDSQTRVATARVEVDNKDGRLKPGMFASGVVQNNIGQTGTQELVIPKSAVLWTGERSIVYVRNEINGRVAFQLREIILGPSLGDSYVVQEGLEPGEEIVTNGTFTVDAAVQLSGRPSMMNPEGGGGGGSMPGMDMPGDQMETSDFVEEEAVDLSSEIPEAFKEQLKDVVDAFLELKNGLVDGDEEETARYGADLLAALEKLDGNSLSGNAKAFWDEKRSFLFEHTKLCKEADSMEGKRENFTFLSQPLVKIVEAFGAEQTLYVDFCPMANDNKGAYWLSEVKEIRNPFMGEEMRTCGEVKDVIK
ncbi:MAG: efflux RND transporter periplasmic adaptor subunit [Anditalea sp.]